MSDTEKGKFLLPVAGARSNDAGKGVTRLNSNAFTELGIRDGDVIEIAGKRSTPAIALGPYPEDEGLAIVRLDGLQRANANVSIGDHVEIRNAEAKEAKKVTFAPAQKNVQLSGPGEALKRTLLHRPLTTGDVVSTSVYRQSTGQEQPDMFPNDFFNMFFGQRAYGLHEMRLVVTFTDLRERARPSSPGRLRTNRRRSSSI